MSSQPLPASLVDRLFSRFTAIYGAQKVGAMWADSDLNEVKGVWAQSLSRYAPQSIGVAIQRLIDSGSGWPPTLPEFCELCRQGAHERKQMDGLALPAPGASFTDNETAKQRVAELLSGLSKSKRMPAE